MVKAAVMAATWRERAWRKRCAVIVIHPYEVDLAMWLVSTRSCIGNLLQT